MSLTNDQITAKNFEEFLNQLQPYFNPDPIPFMTKFNRSDIYSTDERMIGQWTDGKPLYQKTVTGTMNTALDLSSLYIENVVSINTVGTLSNGNVASIPDGSGMAQVFYYKNAKTLRTDTSNSYYAGYPYTATIQYTKTTDSAISIGVDTDYTTTERVVGTWVDGTTPVYQKTILVNDTVANIKTNGISLSVSNLNNILDQKCFIVMDGARYVLPYLVISEGNVYSLSYYYDDTAGKFYFDFGDQVTTSLTITGAITVNYTKSSS